MGTSKPGSCDSHANLFNLVLCLQRLPGAIYLQVGGETYNPRMSR